MGCHVHFSSLPPLSLVLIPLPGYSPAGLFPCFLQGECSSQRGHGAYGQRSSRIGFPLSGILQSPFRCLEGFELVEACYRLASSEFILQTRLSIVQSVGSLLYSEG